MARSLLVRLAGLGLSPSAWVGLVMFALFIFLGVFGPWLAPFDPELQNLDLRFAAPSGAHWLGCDLNGRDTLSQLLHGARVALFISTTVVFVCALVGVAVGTLAGYFRGWVDEIVGRVIDILMAFPGILLNIAVVAAIAHPGDGVLIFALCLNGWVAYARVARGQVLSLRERDYVIAARAIGAPAGRIMLRHIAPNLLSPLMVQMTFGFGTVIAVEASLTFLGVGPQLSYSWGALLQQGTTFLWRPGFAYFALIPGLAIMWIVLGANLLGDGLRDRLDPRQRQRRLRWPRPRLRPQKGAT